MITYVLSLILVGILLYISTCIFGNHDWSDNGYGGDYCQKCHLQRKRIKVKK
jgi:hypothetical protein